MASSSDGTDLIAADALRASSIPARTTTHRRRVLAGVDVLAVMPAGSGKQATPKIWTRRIPSVPSLTLSEPTLQDSVLRRAAFAPAQPRYASSRGLL
jgi:hypothetical protein